MIEMIVPILGVLALTWPLLVFVVVLVIINPFSSR